MTVFFGRFELDERGRPLRLDRREHHRLGVLLTVGLSLFVLSSCRRAADDRNKSALDAGTSGRLPESKRQALERCQKARAEAVAQLEAPTSDVSSASSRLAPACADLYTERACGDAFRGAAQVPVTERAASIARACRDAYCPRLTAPKPRLCAEATLPAPSELASQWSELSQRILSLELDMSPDAVAAALPVPSAVLARLGVDRLASGSAVPVAAAAPLDATAPARVAVELAVDAQGATLAGLEGEPPVRRRTHSS